MIKRICRVVIKVKSFAKFLPFLQGVEKLQGFRELEEAFLL